MANFLRRRLRCFYCQKWCKNDQPGIPKTWSCPHCEAVNHLDQRGQFTDPPPEVSPSVPRVQYARPRERPPAPSMALPFESSFCDNCLRNQTLVNRAMANYIPDEDHPDYKRYVDTADAYRAELEERYPLVCENCEARVQAQVRAAGYTAKTDHLRRILENSKQRRLQFYTTRQVWLLRIVSLAKWSHGFSFVVGLVWHAGGIFTAPGIVRGGFDWNKCYTRLKGHRSLDETCFGSEPVLVVGLALLADFLTLWWNPKWKLWINRPGGRIRRLIPSCLLRIFIFCFRVLAFIYVSEIPKDDEVELNQFRLIHGMMLAFILILTPVSWNLASLEYQSTASFMQPLDPYLPKAPPLRDSQTQPYQPVRPKATAYDTMAQSFTSAFLKPSNRVQLSDSPPSSTRTDDSDTFAPSRRSEWPQGQGDDMDWTPTRKRFGKEPISLQPNPWAPAPEQPKPLEPHSIFAKRDPNPFAHKVPAFPKGPAAQNRDPWRPGVWTPALPETKKNFFAEMMKQGTSPESRDRVEKGGVPRNVKRDDELFRKPQFKYDHYGYATQKTTGLEEGFNNLFQE